MTERYFSAERLSKLTGEPHTEGRWIDLSKLKRVPQSVAPMVIGDIKRPFQSQMSGKMISSRRHYRDELRAYGCVEVGNDMRGTSANPEFIPDPKDIVDDIKRAIEQGPPVGMEDDLKAAEAAIDA